MDKYLAGLGAAQDPTGHLTHQHQNTDATADQQRQWTLQLEQPHAHGVDCRTSEHRSDQRTDSL